MREETYGAVSGFLAGILNALAVGPLDVVKVSQNSAKNRAVETGDTCRFNAISYKGKGTDDCSPIVA